MGDGRPFMYSTGAYSQLQNISDSGSPPKTRIASAMDARNLFQVCWRAYERRRKTAAIVKGLIDGNKPFPDMTKNGQKYRANFNNGEAYAYLETAISAYYDIFSEPETYATVTFENSKNPEAWKWGEVATKNFQWLQKQDDAMDFNHQKSIHDTVVYGIGPQVFSRKLDWRSRAIPQDRLYVADDEPANVADFEFYIIQGDYKVNEMWDFISDEDTARDLGWNVEQVKQSIMRARPRQWGTEWDQWMRWQEALRNNDIYLGSQCAKVRTANIFFKEFSEDGAPSKITELWVDLDQSSDEFLMRKEGSYDDMRQTLFMGYYDRGDGFHQSIKGLGVKQYPVLVAGMRLQLTAFDAACASSTVYATSNMPAGKQTLSNVEFGAMTLLPSGMQIQQPNLQGVLEPAQVMMQDLKRTLDSNLSSYRQRLQLPEGNPPTKYQFQAVAAQGSTLGKTSIARYCIQLDDLYTEKFRRASNKDIAKGTKNKWLKLALEFQKRCKDDGIPASEMENATVRATRIAGQGSPFMREQALMTMYSTIGPRLPEDGQENLTRDMVSAFVGPVVTPRYWTKGTPSTTETQDRWEAQMEHGLLYDGGTIEITPQQNDVIHLTVHFTFLNEAAASLQQGANVDDVYNTLVAGLRHTEQHLVRLAQNPTRKGEFEQFKAIFNELAKTVQDLTKMLQQRAQEQAQAQAEFQQAQAGADVDRFKAENKAMIDRAKAEQQMALKGAKAQQDMALKDAKTAQDLRLTNAKATQDLSIEGAKGSQDLTRQAIENAGLITKQRIENQKPAVGE